MLVVVPPTQIATGLEGWVVIPGSPTTVTSVLAEVVLQSEAGCVRMTLYQVLVVRTVVV